MPFAIKQPSTMSVSSTYSTTKREDPATYEIPSQNGNSRIVNMFSLHFQDYFILTAYLILCTNTLYNNLQGINAHLKLQTKHQKKLGGMRAAMFVYGIFNLQKLSTSNEI